MREMEAENMNYEDLTPFFDLKKTVGSHKGTKNTKKSEGFILRFDNLLIFLVNFVSFVR